MSHCSRSRPPFVIAGIVRSRRALRFLWSPYIRAQASHCGSPVLTDTERAREQGLIFIKAGRFDDGSDLDPTTHYWTKRAHHWLPLPHGVELKDRE